jgi:hypothetical protein
MSTANAAWFFKTVRAGDLVKVVNSNGDMMPAFGNGHGEWNLDWQNWQKGSALVEGPRPEDRARLSPVSA